MVITMKPLPSPSQLINRGTSPTESKTRRFPHKVFPHRRAIDRNICYIDLKIQRCILEFEPLQPSSYRNLLSYHCSLRLLELYFLIFVPSAIKSSRISPDNYINMFMSFTFVPCVQWLQPISHTCLWTATVCMAINALLSYSCLFYL